MYIIPLTCEPNQTFQCTIPVDGENRALRFGLRYNRPAHYWTLSVTDMHDAALLIDGMPLLTGEYPAANLLEQYGYLGLGSAVIVPVGAQTENVEPDAETLGTDFLLVWGDTLGEI